MFVQFVASGTGIPEWKSHDWNVERTPPASGRKYKTLNVKLTFESRLMNIRALHSPTVYTRHHKRLIFDGNDRTHAVCRNQLAPPNFSLGFHVPYLTRYKLDDLSTSRKLHSVRKTPSLESSDAASINRARSGWAGLLNTRLGFSS